MAIFKPILPKTMFFSLIILSNIICYFLSRLVKPLSSSIILHKSIFPISLIFHLFGLKCSISMWNTVYKVSWICLSSRIVYDFTFSFYLILRKVSLILKIDWVELIEYNFSFSLFIWIMKLSLIIIIIFILIQSMTIELIIFPLTLINLSIIKYSISFSFFKKIFSGFSLIN